MDKKRNSGILSRLISLILAISLVIGTGSLLMPETASYAYADPAPVLKISQDLRTESGVRAADLTFGYRLSATSPILPLPEGAAGSSWDFQLTGDEQIHLHFLAGSDSAEPSEIPIRFTSRGIYRYTLSQLISDRKANITYDETVYDITVQVDDRNGLRVEAVWAQRDTGDKPDSIAFANTIGTPKVIGDPPVEVVKRIEGSTPTKKDKFIFVMAPERSDFPLPYGAKGEYETVLYGEGQIEIGNIEFEGTGTYSYRVYEKATASSDYTFDRTVYRVIYRVNMEEDGTLSCQRRIINEDSDTDKCVFTNIHKSPSPTPRNESVPEAVGGPGKGNDPGAGSDHGKGNDPGAGSGSGISGGDGAGSSGDDGEDSARGNGTRTGDSAALVLCLCLMLSALISAALLRLKKSS